MKRITWIILGYLVLMTTAQAASFDCAKAQSKMEHLICDNPRVSNLDETLGKTYHDALVNASETEKSRLIADQKLWLKSERNGCANPQCLETAYRSRLTELDLILPSRPTLYKRKSDEQLNTCRGVAEAANGGRLDALVVPESGLAQVDINDDGMPERVTISSEGNMGGQSLEILDKNGNRITPSVSDEDDWGSNSLSGINEISLIGYKNKIYILAKTDGQLSYLAHLDGKNTEKVICEFGQRNDGAQAFNYVLSEYERIIRNASASSIDPWSYALMSQSSYGLLVLLDAKHDFHLNKTNNGFDSAVHEAIRMRKYDALRLMLENGADPNVVDGATNMPALNVARGMAATEAGAKEAVSLLIKSGANERIYTGPIIKQEKLGKQDAVSIFAGSDGQPGSDDGVGETARFNNPYGITSDGSNLYVTDNGNHTIRKIEISTRIVTTLAGVAGKSGESDGIGGGARFSGIGSITTDGTNLYVVDHHAIRKIVIATGAVTTLAGVAGISGLVDGPGKIARFRNLLDITTDGTSIYVTEIMGLVRKIVIATGEVSTFAGDAEKIGSADGSNATARFVLPFGITTDGISLYVSDNYNGNLRKIQIATGEVATLAGPNNAECGARCPVGNPVDGSGIWARFYSPMSIALDGKYLYLADKRYIRRILAATGETETLSGGQFVSNTTGESDSLVHFLYTGGIAADKKNVYVVDVKVHAIYKIRKPR